MIPVICEYVRLFSSLSTKKGVHFGWFIECMKQLGLLKLILNSKIECRYKLLTPEFFKVSLKVKWYPFHNPDYKTRRGIILF